eukprot:CAMPEP_0194146430 /NCGR_PEP_ID=MMETSP0152-20130528/20587_1 /TAXON_ID=1049557 /ORGANISM="Thalassiothrix antarctica, Strain L6-D1" /LENGTH=513 /DNA_ID=CAMNT_0038846951 /DNA_START=30 /DNA_END=1571 /DNA_ORIENTATION=+
MDNSTEQESSNGGGLQDKPPFKCSDGSNLPLQIGLMKEKVGGKPRSASVEGGNGNNSDNSANSGIMSIGNNSFGFNFDENEAMTASSTSPQELGADLVRKPAAVPAALPLSLQQEKAQSQAQAQVDEQTAAATEAVERLGSIANAYKDGPANQPISQQTHASMMSSGSLPSLTLSSTASISTSLTDEFETDRPRKKAKKMLDEGKREERNAREKERSFRISRQINELRSLLSSGGVIVPKGTKSSVLTEAANYIRMLQQHQYRSEIDRHQLVQQMQMIGGGALGTKASSAIRHVAAQNGVWSLGNFGGVPPKSAMTYYQGAQQKNGESNDDAQNSNTFDPNAPVQTEVEDHEYRFIFNSCSVGMAIASMGGAFIDCNNLFCQLSNYSKQEVCSMTVFNLTSRQDLQHAFDLISQMISPPSDGCAIEEKAKPCVLRGSMKNRHDLGLSVSLIRGDDDVAKCFCITLIKNPASPFDISKPVPASSDLIQALPAMSQLAKDSTGAIGLNTPAFTTG